MTSSPAQTTDADGLPDDVAAAVGTIVDRLRTKTVDQVIAIGERTGWWTAELVDWVADGRDGPAPTGPAAQTTLRQEQDRRLEQLEEQLTEAGALAPSGHITDVLLHEEAAASVSLDGETQVVGGAYTAPAPRSDRVVVVDLHHNSEFFDQQMAKAEAAVGAAAPDPNDPDLPIAGQAYIAVLQGRELGVDHTYQRPLDEPRVRRMVATWNPRMLGTIEVSDRGPDAGPVRYAVINGQHRAAAAAQVSPAGADVWLPCNVHEGLTVAQEARLMRELDRSTKKLSGFDQWRARKVAGDEAVTAVERIVTAHGLRIAPDPADGNMRSYGTAEKLLQLGGERLLDSALAVLRAAYGDAAAAYQAPLLRAVGHLVHRHADLEVDRLTRALSGTRPEQLRAAATALRDTESGPLHELMAIAITARYDRTPGSGLRGRLSSAASRG